VPERRRRDDEDPQKPHAAAARGRKPPARKVPGVRKITGTRKATDARSSAAPRRETVKRSPSSAKRSSERRDSSRGDERTGRPTRRPGAKPSGGTGSRARRDERRPDERRGEKANDDRKGRPGPRKGAPAGKSRHSKASDDRNPTRSGIDYPSRKTRVRGAEPEPEPTRRPSLRKVQSKPAAPKATRTRKAPPSTTKTPRRRRPKSTEALDELARVAGRGAAKAQDQLAKAAEAFSAGRERDAARLLRPLRDAYPDVAAVRELLGLCQYRTGNFEAATKELEAFVQLTGGDVEQHPVLMDCARAKRKYRKVDELWRELADSSPSATLVTEGRIVLAGSLADRGRLQDAIATLERRSKDSNRVQEYHLRAWYALADLYERAGDIPRARQLFLQVRKHEAGFADVAERLASLN